MAADGKGAPIGMAQFVQSLPRDGLADTRPTIESVAAEPCRLRLHLAKVVGL